MDFYYAAELNATFKYVNAAPQWQTFNGGNWEQIERDVREYANKNKVKLEVYTGTYGVATLPNEKTKQEVKLYLYTNQTTKAVPVPAMFWKAVYEPKSQKGIVLIGLNNPYERTVSKHIICEDVSSRINWLQWTRDSIAKGYSYACSIPNFRKFYHIFPHFAVSQLLL